MRIKLTLFLLTAFFWQVSATTYAQKITLKVTHAPLSQVIEAIRAQSGYDFLYNNKLLKNTRPITIDVKDASVEEVLKLSFDRQPLTYKIENKAVLIKEKQKTFLDKVIEKLQQIDVRGRVVNEQGEALVGATVLLKGTDRSVTTTTKGEFYIPNVAANAQIVITYIGYEAAELSVKENLGDIIMLVAENQLGEVGVTVNTGYQRIRPEQSTGAVSQLSTKEFESRISTNFLDGLVNRMPGLMINNDVQFTSTAPDGSTSSRPLFNIRGISTMSANQNPLIVIDGYPTELTLDMIDPNEIKSVTILKDAAAATVYGVRASNGVIVIEKKEASIGKPKFAFRATAGITPKEDYDRYRWASDASAIVVDYSRDRYEGSVSAASWDQLATGISGTGGASKRSPIYYVLAQQAAGMITPEQAEETFNTWKNYDNLNDYSRLFHRPTVKQMYNFNVSGGNDNALYYITANYTDNQTSQIKNGNNSFLLSARSTLKFSKRLSLELTTDYQEQRTHGSPVPSVTAINPFERFEDVNGNPAYILGESISPWYNAVMTSQGLDDVLYYPLRDVDQISSKDRTVNNRITGNFKYDIGRGFELAFGGVYETSNSEDRYYAGEESSVTRRYINSYVVRNADGSLQYPIPKGGYLQEDTYHTSSYTARGQLNYNKIFNSDHSINGIIGGEIRNLVERGNRMTLFGYNDETLLHQAVDLASINRGAIVGTYRLGSPFTGALDNLFNQRYTEDRFVSAYANLVYSYRNTYTLTSSIRIDQSNLFGTNPKYKYKPLWSVGAAWNIHREDFMEDASWVNELKLRAGYGFNGNVAKMSLPQVIAQARINNYISPSSPTLQLAAYANSSLRWEQTNNFNVGLDYVIFKNITGSVDYYKKNSVDLLGKALIDPTVGVSPSLINQATIRNTGIEFSLRADWISTPQFNWNTGLVIAHNGSKVLDVFQQGSHNPEVRDALGYVKGYPVGALFAYRYAGLDSAGFPLVTNTRGDLYHTNDNRLGSHTNEVMSSDTSGVIRFMGTSIPTINAGLSNRVDFGNFYIFAMLNYYGGFKVHVPRPNPSVKRPLEGAGNYWKKPGDERTTDVMGLAAYSSYNSNSAYNYADSYVVRGDYLTLGDLTFSYRLNDVSFIRKAGFSNFEIKAQASNIWTVGFNKYNYSRAAGSYQKGYMTPTYTLAIFTNF